MILDPEEAFNSTDDDIMDDEDPSMDKPHFQMPYAADVSWTVVFSIMITCAILGNLVVFWIVLGKWIQCCQLFVENENIFPNEVHYLFFLCISGHRRMQNVTNYFLVNLSLADLMMSCLNTIFNFIFMKSRCVTQFAVHSFQNRITKCGYRHMKAILLSFAEIGFSDRFTALLTTSSHICPLQFPSLPWWPFVLIGK